MTSNRLVYRSKPDLIDQIARLEKRVATLESGRRLGSSSIDNGTLVVRNGDISVRDEDDNERVKLTHGVNPSTYYRPKDSSDGVRARQVAFASGGVTSFQSYMVRDSDGFGDGGKLLLTKEYAYLSHQPFAGEETFIGLSAYSAYNNHFLFRGKWISDAQFQPWNALYMGTIDVAAGFGGIIWNYDYEYPALPLLTYSITGAAANFNHCITAQSTTGFTISWSDALAHSVHYMVWRR